jgi:hypothetical protein
MKPFVLLEFVERIPMIGNESARGTEFQALVDQIQTMLPSYHLRLIGGWIIPRNFWNGY